MIRHSRRLLAALAIGGLAVGVTACGSDDAGSADTTTGGAGATIRFRPLDVGGPLTVQALKNGDIQIGLLFTTDGTIAANGWVVLTDDKGLQAADNIVPLGRADKLTDDVAAVLNRVTAAITTDEITALNKRVDIDKEDAAAVARSWVQDKGFATSDTTVSGSFTIGSFNFGESEILANIYALALEGAGAQTTVKAKLGSREVVAPALENGEIDLVPEYVASASSFFGGSPTSDVTSSLEGLRTAIASKGLTALEAAPARNTNELVVTAETASRYGLKTISDLAKVTEVLVMGGPPECPQRPFCIPGYAETYGLRFEV
jgi:osmoprotectant transport system substrate-binding protein